MVKVVLGFDPGTSGALGVLDAATGTFLDVMDLPWIKESRKELNIQAFLSLVRQFEGHVVMAGVEQVNAGAVRSVMSSFSFGGAYYCIRTACACYNIPYQLVPPQQWKKHYRIAAKSDKDKSRALVLRLMPKAPVTLKKDHNKAESLLIARYIWETSAALKQSEPKLPVRGRSR